MLTVDENITTKAGRDGRHEDVRATWLLLLACGAAERQASGASSLLAHVARELRNFVRDKGKIEDSDAEGIACQLDILGEAFGSQADALALAGRRVRPLLAGVQS